jgi:hypothetical protein
LECNMGLPANPAGSNSARSGRGKQYIVRQPQENRGIAVVRVEDQAGGSETYRFDLEWRGSTGGVVTGGFGNGGTFRPPRTPGICPSRINLSRTFLPPTAAIAGWNEMVRGRGGSLSQLRGSTKC